MPDKERAPRISVVIPTFRRRDIVTKNVRAFSRQEFGSSFEVIVVVDGSDDGSTDALRELNVGVPLIVLDQPNRGAAKARNHGASIASGEILLFLDDDMEPHPRLLEEHDHSHCEGADAVMGHLPLHPDTPLNFLSSAMRSWAEERKIKLTQPGAKPESFEVLTGQLSISRALFFELGQFDTDFTNGGSFGNEDTEFGYRLSLNGCNVIFNPKAISWQNYAVKPRDYLRKMFQAGHADVLFARKHPLQMTTIFSPDSPQRRLVKYFWRPLQKMPTLSAFMEGIVRSIALTLIDRGVENFLATRLFREAGSAAYWRGVWESGGVPRYQSVRVLTYHSLSNLPTGSEFEPYGIPVEQFRQQIRVILSAGYHFISVDEFVRFIEERGGLPRRALLLTFDDAYADLPSALPLLRERGISAAVFVISGRIGCTNDWDQRIGAPTLTLLGSEGLRQLVSNGFEIGLHSRTHPFMTRITDGDLIQETREALNDMERAGLGRPRLFAYPHGDHDRRVEDAVKEAGFTAACTVEAGVVRPGVNPFAIPRIEILKNDTGWRLLVKIGTGGLSSKVAQRLRGYLLYPKRISKKALKRYTSRRTSASGP